MHEEIVTQTHEPQCCLAARVGEKPVSGCLLLEKDGIRKAESSLKDQHSIHRAPFQGVPLGVTSASDLYLATLEKQLLRMSAMEQLRSCCFAGPQVPAVRGVGGHPFLCSALRDSARVFLSLILFFCFVPHLLT
ncbi:hypothetical protein LSCM1_07817 [Leishmania martiniquensis]|uniref:Uncharacterized protein n=1 Tax=Leishmania martiniquensis TaxID=1580590 RepID=A0A836L0E6_9TRYP|nr:hypothetical protein LSCM1_07817 [Leishmania martiniquensis]